MVAGERVEGVFQVGAALGEMRPAVAVHGDDHGIRECVRGFDRIIGVHGEVERSTCLRGAGKQQDHARAEAAGDLRDTVEPDGIAGDVDRRHRDILECQHEADHVAAHGLDAGGAVACGGRGDRQFRSGGID